MAISMDDLVDYLASLFPEARLVAKSQSSAEPESVLVDASHDSRAVGPGWLFCCVPGHVADGHDFAAQAVAAGASALLVERELELEVPQIVVGDVRAVMGTAAAAIHDHPSSKLRVIGVTGTNGKSSIVQLLVDVFSAAGVEADLIGTLKGARTTPESTDLQRLLADALKRGVDVMAMEVSSHALALKRVTGTQFAAAVFTNLTHDHLDFHGTVDNYFAAKAELFNTTFTSTGVVNADDNYGRRLLDGDGSDLSHLVSYTLADAEGLRFDGAHSLFSWRGHPVDLPLAGAHNVSNALAAAATASLLGLDEPTVAAALGGTKPVRGRFELVERGQPFLVAVDYAHTPDALDAALTAARQAAGTANVLVVFGCGGDRDVQKRPEMGRVAEHGADTVIVTSDNPRSEDPSTIMAAIKEGFSRPNDAHFVLDRREAIEFALTAAAPGDVVLIAGKGHETYQVIGDQTLDFDDRQVVEETLGAAT